MTFPAAVTKAPALPARQGYLEVCAHSATTSLTASRPTTAPAYAPHVRTFQQTTYAPKLSMQRPATSPPFAAVAATAKQNPIKNQHWASV
jgi:hypothetical protein